MSTPQQRVEEDLKQSMKARDAERTSTLRMLLASLKNEKISLGHEVTEEEFVTVVQRGVKQRQDSVEQYRKGMALLGGADAGLSQAHRPLGGEREAGSDARTAPRGVARGLRSREGHTAARQVGEGEAAAPVRRRTAARVVASTFPALTLYSNTTHSIRWHPPGAPEARSQHTDFAGH